MFSIISYQKSFYDLISKQLRHPAYFFPNYEIKIKIA